MNRVFTFNKRLLLANSTIGNWIDMTMVNKGSRKKDYREVWMIDEMELDDNYFIEYFPDDDDDDDNDDEYGSDSEDGVLGSEV